MHEEAEWQRLFKTHFNKTGITAWGYGPPGDLTRELVDRGYVELEFGEGGLWRGVLTKRGHEARDA